jgi:hypothetical protein
MRLGKVEDAIFRERITRELIFVVDNDGNLRRVGTWRD